MVPWGFCNVNLLERESKKWFEIWSKIETPSGQMGCECSKVCGAAKEGFFVPTVANSSVGKVAIGCSKSRKNLLNDAIT